MRSCFTWHDSFKQANGITPKASDALSGELWEVKKERIKKASIHGNLPGWDLRSVSIFIDQNNLLDLHYFWKVTKT